MKLIQKSIYMLLMMVIGVMATGCSDDNKSGLSLNGETYITALNMGGYDAEIDNKGKSVKVGVPFDFDASTMTLQSITLECRGNSRHCGRRAG